MNLGRLLKRCGGGILFLAVVMGGILSVYGFLALCVVLSAGLSLEFYRMTVGRRYMREQVFIILAITATLVLSWFCLFKGLDVRFVPLGLIPVALASVLLLYDDAQTLDFPVALYFPLVYVFPALLSAMLIVFPQGTLYTWRILLGIMVILWLNDIGAYLAGMGFGQRPDSRKLFPALSPKKSWAGVVGGTLFSFLAAWGVSATFGSGVLPLVHWLGLALIVSVFGVFGDLFESLVKRHAKVKDSGSLIPGHGGLLDRFDDVIFVLPLSAIYLFIFSMI